MSVATKKRARTAADVEQRRQWQAFSFTPEYRDFQIKAMAFHRNMTRDVIDRIDVAPHDAFGHPLGDVTSLRRAA